MDRCKIHTFNSRLTKESQVDDLSKTQKKMEAYAIAPTATDSMVKGKTDMTQDSNLH